MKDVLKFLMFIIYATTIFFLPNHIYILACFIINLAIILLCKLSLKKAIFNTLKIVPFVLFTFIINLFLDSFIFALWIGIKLLIVCNTTFIYSQTTTVANLAKTIRLLCTPLKLFKVNTEEIEVMVCISLSLLPAIRNDLTELKNACKAKNIDINLKNAKYILSKFLLSLIKRVNQIDEAMIEKGCDY